MNLLYKCFYIYKNRIMNREELIKIIDNKFNHVDDIILFDIKELIFDTIIPEVVKELKPSWTYTEYGWIRREFLQKAKELYWIDL